nr:37S ribosomal protein S25, mitochondrial-like [Quercus suber]POF16567.1 37s ribosomal protein s25, mitochondrial [Quercus suber]
MGRIGLEAQRVRRYATQLLDVGRISSPPPWYGVMGVIPPSERLVRPPMQRPQKPGKRASKLFKPLHLNYEEDLLRWEYFNDHPWELARPRVVLEDDGRDAEKWDWSLPLDHSLKRPGPGDMLHNFSMLVASPVLRPGTASWG